MQSYFMFSNRLTLCPNDLVKLFNTVVFISVPLSIPSHCFECAMVLVPEIYLD